MKSVIKILLSFTLCLSLFNIKVSAEENLYDKMDLDNYVVSGDGSLDDPYILSEDCPYIPFLNAKVIKEYEDGILVNEMPQTRASESTYNGSVKVKNGTSQTTGGYWIYSSNAPSSVSDGACWIHRITWIDAPTVRNTPQIYNNTNYLSILANCAGFATSIGGVIASFANATALSATLTVAGGALAVLTAPAVITSLNNYDKYQVYASAGSQNKGVMKLVYSTSYHGSWYQTRANCVWTNYPYAYYPATYFGTGTYNSNWKNAPFVQ